MELRWLSSPEDVPALVAATALFDHDVRREWAATFLARPNHHVCLAVEGARPVGFVTGVDVTHPDKGTEMFLYELAVDEGCRGQGVGRALVQALADRARTLGCYGMWVLTDNNNEAALATYRSAGAVDQQDTVMLSWRLDPGHETFR
ncbi:MAG: GNAT family N-acetyltransferase [Actinomycetota bacterium]|nr:GNAT family N-acetyltransferase [Actinomycetota bacterium]